MASTFRLSAKGEKRTQKRDKTKVKPMKKLLLITLAIGGLAFIPAQRSDAEICVLMEGNSISAVDSFAFSPCSGTQGRPLPIHIEKGRGAMPDVISHR